jgi:hypothetical protein
VGQAGKYESFAPKPFAQRGVRERAGQQQLDSDVALEVVVMRLPNLAHPALADRLDESVTAEDGTRSERQAARGLTDAG